MAITWGLTACRSNSPQPTQRVTLIVGAAASLATAFSEIERQFEARHPDIQVTFSFAASGVLQLQIEQGAPMDVFASAASQQMDALERKQRLVANTRKNFARNRLVVITPGGQNLWMTQLSDLRDPRINRIAIGNPNTVPAGTYAHQALKGLYPQLKQEKTIILADNVRQVLTYVEQGNVDAGIVYASDGAIAKNVRVAVAIPLESTDPILYPIAVLKQSQSPQQATAFVQFVTSPAGQRTLQQYGFLSGLE